MIQQEHRTGYSSRCRTGRGKADRQRDAADDAQTRALAFFQSTFGAVILHFVNLPIPRAQAKGDDEHAEALRQKAAAQTGRRICWSWRRDIAPPLIPKGWSFVRNPPTSPMISAMCGLRDVLVSSGACEAAPKDINWRLTVGFEFRVWRDLWWHLRRCIVINLRLCLPSWQPVTLSRAIGDLTSNCRSRSNTRVKT